jgi:hypothetical protein
MEPKSVEAGRGNMNKIFLILAGMLAAGTAQAQDTYNSGSFRFGLSPTNSNTAAKYERDNPVNRMPWDGQANAAPSGAGPQLGPEGGGTPMSRGGINDTLTSSNPRATITAPQPAAKPKPAKQADKSKTQGAKP